MSEVAEKRVAGVSNLPSIEGGEELDGGDGSVFSRDAIVALERIENNKVGERVDGGVEKLK